ncbi:hypothetical protein PMAYCL1PPCAC_24072 [Pristionchus mayeri]|uniref:Uncharacterized protein n=1 Tax=Pristionchus mayeri TaxID=1317129 RepID=A0AAN5I662_9BILA|nr:hypothetical protein PMAYCL1PPCAC_24072 [Pristionchus mayeri]
MARDSSSSSIGWNSFDASSKTKTNGSASIPQNISLPSPLSDFSTILASLLQLNGSDSVTSSSPHILTSEGKESSLVNVLLDVFDSMDILTSAPFTENSLVTPTSVLPSIPTDLRDILTSNGFNVPDMKNLSSLVDSIDRFNEFLSDRTKEMIDSITRTIEEAFNIGDSKEKMMGDENERKELTKEMVLNVTERKGGVDVSWNDIKKTLMKGREIDGEHFHILRHGQFDSFFSLLHRS